MNWNINKNKPICPQIMEQICIGISSGELVAGEKIMSVRDVAVAASVNPNTVQKAFENLQNKGILISVRGSGWFVNDNTLKAKECVNGVIKTKTEEYIACMRDFGLTYEQITELIKEEFK